MIYTPTPTYAGSDTLNLSLTDPGDGLSGSATVPITISPVSAPTITAPSGVSVNENSSFTFSNPNTISVGDSANGGGNTDSLTLSVGHGNLTLASTAGLTFTAGSNGSSSMTVTGTVSNIDADLGAPSPSPAIVYSNLGPGLTYNATISNGVAGPNNADFPGFQVALAQSFTPTSTVTFDAVLLPLAYDSGTNSVTVDLFASSGGLPASTPLESFTVTGLPLFPSQPLFQLNSVAALS